MVRRQGYPKRVGGSRVRRYGTWFLRRPAPYLAARRCIVEHPDGSLVVYGAPPTAEQLRALEAWHACWDALFAPED